MGESISACWAFVAIWRTKLKEKAKYLSLIYIFEDIWLWLYFMARIWSPATRCGALSLWQGRAGLGQTGHFLCQHPNIPLGAKPFRWSGKTWNFYITLWDQTSIVCFQRQIYLREQIYLSSVLDKHVDKMFSWKKEMAQIMYS